MQAMADICDNTSRQAWNHWESDLHLIPVHMAKHLVKHLKISLDWLYLGKGNPPEGSPPLTPFFIQWKSGESLPLQVKI